MILIFLLKAILYPTFFFFSNDQTSGTNHPKKKTFANGIYPLSPHPVLPSLSYITTRQTPKREFEKFLIPSGAASISLDFLTAVRPLRSGAHAISFRPFDVGYRITAGPRSRSRIN